MILLLKAQHPEEGVWGGDDSVTNNIRLVCGISFKRKTGAMNETKYLEIVERNTLFCSITCNLSGVRLTSTLEAGTMTFSIRIGKRRLADSLFE